MKGMKIKFLSILMIFACFSVFSQSYRNLFNSKITESELTQLANGETVIRNVGSKKNLSLTNSNSEYITKIKEELDDKNPNYLAEVIKIIPKTENNTDLKQKLYEVILDIESYSNIPYYSEHNEKWFKLYNYAKINSLTKTGNQTNIDFTAEMDPFGVIDMKGVLIEDENSLFYSMVNTSKVVYDSWNITCVSKNKMYNAITLFEYDDYYILYGVGGVKAPSIFFLRDRIDTAFIGRIKYFCKYMFENYL